LTWRKISELSVPPIEDWEEWTLAVHSSLEELGIDTSDLDLAESIDYIASVGGMRVNARGAIFSSRGRTYLLIIDDEERKVYVYKKVGDRLDEIYDLVKENGTLTVEEIASVFGISTRTARNYASLVAKQFQDIIKCGDMLIDLERLRKVK